MAFTDLAVLQSELELRRRRELHRQNSHRMHADGQENNFNSLPWEEIIPRRISGVPVMPAEHELRANNNQKSSNKNRSKSQDPRKGRLFGGGGGNTGNGSHSNNSGGSGGASGGGGSGWFNPGQVWKETRENDHHHHQESTRGSGSGASGDRTGNVKQNGHWLLRERETNLAPISMPPNIDTLRDSGIGLSSPQKAEENLQNNLPNLSRNEPKRSSFGMALKDKFNKNPNMYFPGPDSQSGQGSGHGSSKSSSAGKKSSRSESVGGTGSPTKTNTDVDLSDTDTLIHNMSDGSYEKDESLNDDHDSFGSAKGSRSSGNSSLSPHNRYMILFFFYLIQKSRFFYI